MEADVADEIEAEPGTTGSSDDTVPTGTDDERDEAGAREQGVRSEESRDLSSPRLTVHENDHESR
jgi:hypothetical protein